MQKGCFKRWTRIVYSTSDEDFDDLDEFVDFEFMDFFIVWRCFATYKIFPKSVKMELIANILGLQLKRDKVEDNL